MISLLLTMLTLCGLVGGFASYLLATFDSQPFDWKTFAKYLLLGLVASFCVPLFLNTISSTLISDLLTLPKPESYIKLLIVCGFCLLAAVSSQRFITSLTDRLLQQVNEIRAMAVDVDDKINLLVEPELIESVDSTSQSLSYEHFHNEELNLNQLTENDVRVLRAMNDSSYYIRSRRGIGHDLGLSDSQLQDVLDKLAQYTLIERRISRQGHEHWILTRDGQAAARSHPLV